jgi:diguanylate cyclase (GGDEF)-like protein/PAS domain S-box-containing protein
MKAKRNRLTDRLLVKTLLDTSEDILYFKDVASRFIRNSRSHAAIYGVSDPESLHGKTDGDFSPESFARASREHELTLMRTGEHQLNRLEHMVEADGTDRWFSASKYPLRDEQGTVIGVWGISREITEMKRAQNELTRLNKELEEANARLEQLSIRDELSGLYNHRYFYEVLQRESDLVIRRRRSGTDSAMSLILLDIDGFKGINDQYGHLTGDVAIRHVARLLADNARATDICCRHGGDEFSLILPDTPLADGLELAERLRQRVVASPLTLSSGPLRLSVSVGVTSHMQEQTAQELFHAADQRLYLSKNEGRNRVS